MGTNPLFYLVGGCDEHTVTVRAVVLSVGLAAAQGTVPLGGVGQRGNSSTVCVSRADL